MSTYGYCPVCLAPGRDRQRRPNGDDTCERGHIYASSLSLASPFRPPQGPGTDVYYPAHVNEEDQEANLTCVDCDSPYDVKVSINPYLYYEHNKVKYEALCAHCYRDLVETLIG